MLNRISVNGTELEYQLRGTGTGEPVVLIHWGVAATWAEPLLDQPALTSRYQLLSYHRAGFARSGRLEGPPPPLWPADSPASSPATRYPRQPDPPSAWRQDEPPRTAPTPHEPALAIRTNGPSRGHALQSGARRGHRTAQKRPERTG